MKKKGRRGLGGARESITHRSEHVWVGGAEEQGEERRESKGTWWSHVVLISIRSLEKKKT